MKKYITPAAKYINLASEGSLLQASGNPEDGVYEKETGAPSLSNHRLNIWGDED